MRYLVSALIVIVATLVGCTSRPQVAVPSSGDMTGHVAVPSSVPSSGDMTGRLTTAFGEFSPAGSPFTVRVSESDGKIEVSRREQFGTTAVSPSGWKAKSGWFAFIENDESVWAYDGRSELNLFVFTKHSTSFHGPRDFPRPVPPEVYARLSKSVQKGIKNHD
jgi:hypothetical protein